MTVHAVFLSFFLPFTMNTNDKSRKMTPCSEPGSQLASSFLILVQGFHQKLDMTGHAVFCLILPFAMKTNEKQRKMTPDSELGSQLESSFLILVQGISSKVRYDWSCRFLFYITFYNENKPKTKKNDARQRARQASCLGLSYGLPHAGPHNEEI